MEILKSKIIIVTSYNYNINVQYSYCISNEGLLEECHKEQNMAVTVAATAAFCLKIGL